MNDGDMSDAHQLQARLHLNQQHVNDLVGEKQQFRHKSIKKKNTQDNKAAKLLT